MLEKTCEICKNSIEENEETVSCPDCGRVFHKECWRLTGCYVSEECRQKADERKEQERQEKQKALAQQNEKTEKTVNLCSKCGKELNDEEVFCGKCGTPVENQPEEPKERICSNCGRVLNDEEEFCCKCGTKYTDASNEIKPDKKPVYKRKCFLITAVCICVIALVSIIILITPENQVVSKNQAESCAIHTWETVKVIKEVSCTGYGIEERKCSFCGKKEEHKISQKGHKWKINTIKEATCTEDGSEERVCSACGKTEENTIQGGHKWISATCKKPMTCSVCGKTEGEKLKHEYSQCKCIHCEQEIPMTTYKGIKIPQMPFTENGITFLSVDGLTVFNDIQIRIRNDGYNSDEIYYKLYSADGTVLTSSSTFMDHISIGETTIIQLSLYNSNYHVKKVLISTVPFV